MARGSRQSFRGWYVVENGHFDHYFYFPQWLMCNWCVEGNEIWCFDKTTQRIKKKGTSRLGGGRDLYKSDIANVDLEGTIFAEIDGRHASSMDAMLLYGYYGTHTEVPDEVIDFFVDLCLWTSVRNRRVQGWIDITDFTSGIAPDNLVHACTDAELKKAVHLTFCTVCRDGLLEGEASRLKQAFYLFFRCLGRQIHHIGRPSAGTRS